MPAASLSPGRWTAQSLGLVLLFGVVLLAVHVLVGRIPQSQAFHAFCDARRFAGIPSVLNVASNLLFLAVGVAGWRWMRRAPAALDPELRAPYALFFAGLAATAFGSAWYHWAPDDAGLFWDRLPIAVAFMALYTAVLAERITPRASALLIPLVLLGAGSVVWWRLADDLRLYGVVQFFPIVTIPLILWLFPARWTHGGLLIVAILCYIAGKLLEDADLRVYLALGQTLSGHTLKHLAAGAGAWTVYRMLVGRRRLGP